MNGLVSKAVMYSVSLLILVGVIVYGVRVRDSAQPLQDRVNEIQQDRAVANKLQKFAAYDGGEVFGSAVITAVRRYAGDSKITIYLQKKAGSGTAYQLWCVPSDENATSTISLDYNTKKLDFNATLPVSNKFTVAQLKQMGGPYYVSPGARFSSELVQIGTEVYGILFKEL